MSIVNSSDDFSNGWETIADKFIDKWASTIGATTVENWSRSFEPGQTLLDIGCGFGGPYTQGLIDSGIKVNGIDASKTLIEEYKKRFPGISAKCEAAESSSFFDKKFEGILSIGLIFLLPQSTQIAVLQKMAGALKSDGRLLFSSPYQIGDWNDLSTGRKSVSLGREAYISALQKHGLSLIGEYTDEGENHYYDFQKKNALR